MSLIIYHENAIFADRAFAITSNDDIRYEDGDKLFISPCRQVAFVVCGDCPKEEDVAEYFTRLKYIFRSLQILKKRKDKPIPAGETEEQKELRVKRDQELMEYVAKFSDEIRQHQDGKIFAITNFMAICMDFQKFFKKDRITGVLLGPSVSYGTGSAYWSLFHNNGMTPADCYAHVWKVEETVSKKFNTISMAELEPFSLKEEK